VTQSETDRAISHNSESANAELEVLLGPPRAMILLLLDTPCHAGLIAEALTATPGAATYHLNALEAAGLVSRERSGRAVIVHRTQRGAALLRLYQ
jgi:DNA-binding MarR family transcriptional regulator